MTDEQFKWWVVILLGGILLSGISRSGIKGAIKDAFQDLKKDGFFKKEY